jgi:hypothetical protein
MRNFKKLSAALVFAGVVASTMMTLGTTVHAAGFVPGATPGYCKILPVAIQSANDLGLTDLAAYLQSIFDAHCQ